MPYEIRLQLFLLRFDTYEYILRSYIVHTVEFRDSPAISIYSDLYHGYIARTDIFVLNRVHFPIGTKSN